MAAGGGTGGPVGEAHHLPHGLARHLAFGQVPEFDQRNIGGLQQFQGFRRVVAVGEDQAVQLAAEEGPQQLGLLFLGEACLADQQVVAGAGQALLQGLDGGGENGIGDGGDQRADDAAAPGHQLAGGEVGHVAQFAHRLFDLQPGLLRDHVRL
ncbi:hypothetical protein D3C84_681240 [compost metagenome]